MHHDAATRHVASDSAGRRNAPRPTVRANVVRRPHGLAPDSFRLTRAASGKGNFHATNCSSSGMLVPTQTLSHERANHPRGWGAKPRASTPRLPRERVVRRGSRAAEWRVNLERATQLRGWCAKPRACPAGADPVSTAVGMGGAGSRATEGNAVVLYSTVSKGVFMRNRMWLTESTARCEATGVAEQRARLFRAHAVRRM